MLFPLGSGTLRERYEMIKDEVKTLVSVPNWLKASVAPIDFPEGGFTRGLPCRSCMSTSGHFLSRLPLALKIVS